MLSETNKTLSFLLPSSSSFYAFLNVLSCLCSLSSCPNVHQPKFLRAGASIPQAARGTKRGGRSWRPGGAGITGWPLVPAQIHPMAQMVGDRRTTHSGQGISFPYHFLSCDSNRFGVFNHGCLVVNECSLWFWRCAFIQLWRRGEPRSHKKPGQLWTILIRTRNLGKIQSPSEDFWSKLNPNFSNQNCKGGTSKASRGHRQDGVPVLSYRSGKYFGGIMI